MCSKDLTRRVTAQSRLWRLAGSPLVLLAGLLVPGAAQAAHVADHLVISEVGYDSKTESSTASSEFVEVFNPSFSDVVLNAGAEPGSVTGKGSYFFSDAVTNATTADYYKVVNGKVTLSVSSDGIWQFPASSVIKARGIVVICSDSETFFTDFGLDLTKWKALPGSPQLFETRQDGLTDGVPDMIPRFTYTTTAPQLSFTNGGEPAVLFYWDGSSDLVKDVDSVVWKSTTFVFKKVDGTGAPLTYDGPDSDTTPTAFKVDAGTSTVLTTASADISFYRKNIEELGEADSAGNGITGHDESSENYGKNGTVDGTTWFYGAWTPGLLPMSLDGKISDGLSFAQQLAASLADGPNGTASPADYGADGTLTELYGGVVDTNADFVADSLYLAVRGSFFGEPDASANASFVLLDLDPGNKTGVTTLGGSSGQLTDTAGTLDISLAKSGFQLNTTTWANIGFDAAVGMDIYNPTTDDTAGWRTWGTAGTSGTTGALAIAGAFSTIKYDGDVTTTYLKGPGTSYAAADGFETLLPFSSLNATTVPAYIFLVGVTTAGNGSASSPNTLPESTGDSTSTFPQPLDKGVCFSVALGRAVTFYTDADKDGYGSTVLPNFCGAPSSGVSLVGGDCNDGDSSLNPGQTEVCDNKDNNCDSQIDEGVKLTYYADTDKDTFGDPAVSSTSCAAPAGYVVDKTDCDDKNASVNPGATEICDGLDNDCDVTVDEEVKKTFYKDDDVDGYGDANNTIEACTAPTGYVTDNTDCDDVDPGANPGEVEICDDIDNNCDGSTDEGLTFYKLYQDKDLDGYGAGASSSDCQIPTGYSLVAGDCDDTVKAVNPGATEVCNNIDDDCDTKIDDADDSVTGQKTYYKDVDKDGDGASSSGTTKTCSSSAPAGYSSLNTDCNDGDATIYKDAQEVCDDKDNDCDGTVDDGVKLTFYADLDGDSHGNPAAPAQACTAPAQHVTSSDDCNDGDETIFAGNPEVCDTKDNNCNSEVDEGVTTTFYADVDKDGHGDLDSYTQACSVPEGYAANYDDCLDSDPAIFAGNPEVCDGKDNGCDGVIDEGVQLTFYMDADKDGHGDELQTTQACTAPAGYSSLKDDCNDGDVAIFGGAPEECDGKDNDCDGVLPSSEADQDSDGFSQCAGDCADNDAEVKPGAKEVCNDKDDDCDPATDEKVDADGDKVTLCDGDCDDANPDISPNEKESCNGIDDDCNPDTDETVDGDSDSFAVCSGDCDDANPEVGPTATEICNAIDDNCDGAMDEGFTSDEDEDGVAGPLCGGLDCDDNNPDINPDETDICGDGIDQDCSGEDLLCPDDVDDDKDGYTESQGDCDDANPDLNPGEEDVCGDSIDQDCSGDDEICTEKVDDDKDGYTEEQGDCNDDDASIHPEAEEVCGDGIDQDCSDGDEICPEDVDDDGDGFTETEGDCDDTKASINPDAAEVCGDGIDQDCDKKDEACGDDDDTTPPGDDDDTSPTDEDPGSCSCNATSSLPAFPAGTLLMGLLALGAFRRRSPR